MKAKKKIGDRRKNTPMEVGQRPLQTTKKTKGGQKVERPKWLKIADRVTTALIAILVLALLLGFRIVSVDGTSMEPTYHDHNLLPAFKPWHEEDLQTARFPACVVRLEDGTMVLKRLVGRPGDEVSIIDGDTYVNGEKIMERKTQCWDTLTYNVGEDEWLFLGDNRVASYDARYWPGTYVTFDQIRYVVLWSEL